MRLSPPDVDYPGTSSYWYDSEDGQQGRMLEERHSGRPWKDEVKTGYALVVRILARSSLRDRE